VRRLSIALLLAAGCVLHTGPTPLPVAPADCHTSARLAGTWSRSGLSQLGPAHSRYVFGCDCIVEARATLIWARVRGKFRYSVVGDTIVLEQKRTTEVHFTREGDTLVLVWPGGERESLTLDQPSDCANAS
jgi:hypothetical protein